MYLRLLWTHDSTRSSVHWNHLVGGSITTSWAQLQFLIPAVWNRGQWFAFLTSPHVILISWLKDWILRTPWREKSLDVCYRCNTACRELHSQYFEGNAVLVPDHPTKATITIKRVGIFLWGLQFVKKATPVKHNKAKCNKTRYASTHNKDRREGVINCWPHNG